MSVNFSDSQSPAADTAGPLATPADLGPLAWVMEELRKSLEAVVNTMRRQVRERSEPGQGAASAGSASPLATARQQLHQVAGALAMVGQPAVAQLVSAMESAVQGFIDRPQLCQEDSAAQVERAGFAVAEFLDGLLRGKSLSAVGLFPQYRAVSELAGAQRIHPADLWSLPWDWHLAEAPPAPSSVMAEPAGPALRARLDQAVLRIVKSGDAAAARELSELCDALAADAHAQGHPPACSLWRLAGGFFEALGLSLLTPDLHVKRTASRVLVQFAALSKGDTTVSERLGQDLAFFCAQAVPADPSAAPRLMAVRQAWGLEGHVPVPYEQERYGRFDPLLMAQVRKRLVAIRESWSALAGGDASRLRSTGEQFTQMAQALVRLHPPFEPLAQGLVAVIQDLVQLAQVPRAELAMEVATVLLFLEAACQDFEPDDPRMEPRMQRLAQRLAHVHQGEAPQPLESWVEALYRRVSHRQTLGSVVDELRISLAALEKDLDAFARAPGHRESLASVSGRLNQMRGVLSVLGLDQAARAAIHMRDAVTALLQSPADTLPADFDSLGNNLGALGFLADMLSYQPALARKLFVFDERRGELTPVMGRVASPPVPVPGMDAEVVEPVELPWQEAPAPEAESAFKPEFEPESEPTIPPEPEPEPEPASAPVTESVSAPEPLPDDRLKIIGSLKVDQALFNVYLQEADEWSRRLQVEVSEWVLDPRQPLPASLVTWAHSLGGSSSMIGFSVLADLARQLEASFQRTQALAWGTRQHAEAYTEAAEEIRRLLHQFAAGLLPQARPEVAQALKALDQLEVPPRISSAPAGHQLPPAQAPSTPAEQAGLDPDLFVFFEEEAQELLPQLGGALRQWHARPDNTSAREEVLRTLHTLKGSARLAGALSLGGQAHALESLIEQLPPQPPTSGIEPVLRGFDELQSSFEALRAGATASEEVQTSCDGTAVSDSPVARDDAVTEPPAAPPAPAQVVPQDLPAPEAPPVTAVPATRGVPAPAPAAPAAAAVLPPAPSRASHSLVRVRTQLLDRLMNQTGEVMISRARLESELGQMRSAMQELTVNVERLRAQLRDIELQSELQMQTRLTRDPATDFDPLEFDRFTRVQELTRMMAESVGDVATVQRTLQQAVDSAEDHLLAQARQTRELQRDLLRTRMVEFESVADRLHRVVRLAAQESGKQASLTIEGGTIEIDRGILERMTPAFEHLLRNAVAHGIEDPPQRAAAGKPAAGALTIRLAQEGNDVSIRFEDDGAGLPLARIRDKAQSLGLLPAGQDIDEAEAARLIFTPGFSTAGTVSELAGRGIGMDVVRAEVQAMGGRIETRTQAGRGTCFDLVIPLTTAVTQVVMLRCASLVFGVPVPLVDGVLAAEATACLRAAETGQLTHEGQTLPFYWAGALLQSTPGSQEVHGRSVPVALLRSAAQRMALQVDEVLGQQEVVVKHLGPQLARLPGLAGVTVLPTGAVVLIYNPVALAAVHGELARAFSGVPAASHSQDLPASVATVSAAPAPATLPPLILVVDDSSTVRRVTQRLLQREGYRVALAGDGLQALEQLARETPAVVLSDIEMPRMDGFDLVRNLRGDARWTDLPVIMITSRIAQKHREHAGELGVNHYLGKPYPEDELLSLVRRYAQAAVSPRSS